MVLADASKCNSVTIPVCKVLTSANQSHRYKDTQGTLFYNPAQLNGQAVYAAAYMIQSSPSMICPYYNDTTSYRSSTGLEYYVVCGGQYSNGMDIAGGGSTTSKFPELMHQQVSDYLLKHVLTYARSCGVHRHVVSLKIPRSPRMLPLTILP